MQHALTVQYFGAPVSGSVSRQHHNEEHRWLRCNGPGELSDDGRFDQRRDDGRAAGRRRRCAELGNGSACDSARAAAVGCHLRESLSVHRRHSHRHRRRRGAAGAFREHRCGAALGQLRAQLHRGVGAPRGRLAFGSRDLKPGSVAFLTAPVTGTGMEGDQSVVYLDDTADAGLWRYLNNDSLAQHVAQFKQLPATPN